MATKAGKVQLHDIKVGKTFYVVQADFPIVEPGQVGMGEVGMIRRIRVTSKPFFRKLSATMAFNYVDDRGVERWVNLDAMQANHGLTHLTLGEDYFVLLANRRAVSRFVKMFNDRQPTPQEITRTLNRETMLLTSQRKI